jgi:hypothetical protein
MKLQGKSNKQLSAMLSTFGYAESTVYRWLKNGFSDTDECYEAAKLIPGWLDIPAIWWFLGEDLNRSRDAEEEQWLYKLSRLSDRRKQLAIQILNELYIAEHYGDDSNDDLNW